MLNNKNQDFHNARKLALTKAFPVMLGIAFLGVGYGVYMRSCGFDMIWPICMAATIFAGSMEFVTVSLLLSTFNPGYALLLTLIVNGRHLFYGISMLEKYRGMGRKKLWAVSGLIDEAFSLNYMTDVPPGTDRNWFMLFVSLYLYISWIGGTLVTTPEVWVPNLGSGEFGFPLLTGAGRLVIKDTAILAGAIVILADSAKNVLEQLKK